MGSERVPEGPMMAPKTLLGPFGPILAYFGGGAGPKFFQVLLGQNPPKSFFFKIFLVAMQPLLQQLPRLVKGTMVDGEMFFFALF